MKKIEEILRIVSKYSMNHGYTLDHARKDLEYLLEEREKEANKAIEMAHGFLKKFDEQRAYEVLTHYLEKQESDEND